MSSLFASTPKYSFKLNPSGFQMWTSVPPTLVKTEEHVRMVPIATLAHAHWDTQEATAKQVTLGYKGSNC